TGAQFPCEKSLHRLFEEQAAKTPHHIALEMEPRCLTYDELNKRSNQLARFLQQNGVKRGSIAGILLTRSLPLITSVFAVLKAGGTFLNLDAKYPRERLDFMIKDTCLQVLLVQEKQTGTLLDFNILTIDLDRHGPGIAGQGNPNLEIERQPRTQPRTPVPGAPAYIIYTSGSTGIPRGVAGLQKGMINRLNWMWRTYPFKPNEVCCQKTSMNFVDCMWEIFGPLLKGVPLAIIPENVVIDLPAFVHILKTRQVTRIVLVPGLLYRFFDGNTGYYKELSHLTFWVSSGESLQPGFPAVFREASTQITLLNLYGSSEISADVTYHNTTAGREDGLSNVPIGRPIDNSQIYILNGTLSPVPIGIAGEIYAGGAGLAAGYLNQPELTAQRFVSNPFNGNNPALLFKTGDLGRYLADGAIEYLGRKDQQVKVRGFRIEPGEIESHLLRHDHIKETVVVPRKDHSGEDFLCAYYIPVQGEGVSNQNLDPVSLKEYLSHTLPNYMVPSVFVPMDQMPVTPTRKIHRRSLPEPVLNVDTDYLPATSEIQTRLAAIWSGVLGNTDGKPIGIDDDFFQLGGHSLRAMILVGKVHKDFHINLPLAQVFKTPTIRGIEQYILEAGEDRPISIEPVEKRDYYPLSPAQKRLYLLYQMDPGNISYNMPQVLEFLGELDPAKLDRLFQRLIHRHETFRTSFTMVAAAPVQRVHEPDSLEFELEFYELDEEKAHRWINDFSRPFDFRLPPLLRGSLIKVAQERHILAVDLPHINIDGISFGILVRDFLSLYKGEELAGLKLQYKDFSQWCNGPEGMRQVKRQQEYWLKRFADQVPVINLPTDYARPLIQNFEGETIGFALDKKESLMLKELALSENASTFMILLAAFNILLSKVSGNDDIIIGTGTAGRRHEDLNDIIGMFVNTLALRNTPRLTHTFPEFLEQLKRNTLEDFENQDYPFEGLVENLELKRDTSRNPLFDVMFQFNNFEVPGLEVPGLRVSGYRHEWKISKFDLTLWGWEGEEGLTFAFEYATPLFKRETIQLFIRYFKEIAGSVAHTPQRKLGQLQRISPGNKEELLQTLNQEVEAEVKRMMESEQVLQHRLARCFEKYEDNTAVEYGTRTLTYGELNRYSNYIAREIIARGIGKGSFTGVLMDDRMELICTALGILKAGGVFVPLDTSYPQSRLELMVTSTGIKTIIAGSARTHLFADNPGILNLAFQTITGKGESCVRPTQHHPEDPLYIYFTS
ncbi:MAG: amino acid adenylation domain-containing protein, partial [bacterium]|nr:amino acid adenylation domain-containing protein [bacterium]